MTDGILWKKQRRHHIDIALTDGLYFFRQSILRSSGDLSLIINFRVQPENQICGPLHHTSSRSLNGFPSASAKLACILSSKPARRASKSESSASPQFFERCLVSLVRHEQHALTNTFVAYWCDIK